LKVLSTYESVLVVAHNNPDPDAIATGWAIASLVGAKLEKKARLVAGGAVLRSENIRFLELLSPPLELIDEIEEQPGVAYVLVDCSPTAENHLLVDMPVRATAVIDHHEQTGPAFRVRYRDIRSHLIACSTIAAQYLRDQGFNPSRELATALLYGITSDAASSPVLTQKDRRAFSWLATRSDYNLLAAVETAPLPRSHFRDLRSALNNAVVIKDSVFCFLPQIAGPETVAEIADLLIRCDGATRALCAGIVGTDVLVSVRCSRSGSKANHLIRHCLRGLGQGGGHERRAGGKIVCSGSSAKARREMGDILKTRWLEACGLPSNGSVPLVGKESRSEATVKRE
jgi:nanoRNase/pAp phosphatase (c-di-AMP/oligoRNAs hydrolase)